MAIRRYLDEAERLSRFRPFDRVKDLIGSVDSGVSDIGTRHREFLLDRFRKRG
jgi:hypothetical protein